MHFLFKLKYIYSKNVGNKADCVIVMCVVWTFNELLSSNKIHEKNNTEGFSSFLLVTLRYNVFYFLLFEVIMRK